MMSMRTLIATTIVNRTAWRQCGVCFQRIATDIGCHAGCCWHLQCTRWWCRVVGESAATQSKFQNQSEALLDWTHRGHLHVCVGVHQVGGSTCGHVCGLVHVRFVLCAQLYGEYCNAADVLLHASHKTAGHWRRESSTSTAASASQAEHKVSLGGDVRNIIYA